MISNINIVFNQDHLDGDVCTFIISFNDFKVFVFDAQREHLNSHLDFIKSFEKDPDSLMILKRSFNDHRNKSS